MKFGDFHLTITKISQLRWSGWYFQSRIKLTIQSWFLWSSWSSWSSWSIAPLPIKKNSLGGPKIIHAIITSYSSKQNGYFFRMNLSAVRVRPCRSNIVNWFVKSMKNFIRSIWCLSWTTDALILQHLPQYYRFMSFNMISTWSTKTIFSQLWLSQL